jgi:hypothetical protein
MSGTSCPDVSDGTRAPVNSDLKWNIPEFSLLLIEDLGLLALSMGLMLSLLELFLLTNYNSKGHYTRAYIEKAYDAIEHLCSSGP